MLKTVQDFVKFLVRQELMFLKLPQLLMNRHQNYPATPYVTSWKGMVLQKCLGRRSAAALIQKFTQLWNICSLSVATVSNFKAREATAKQSQIDSLKTFHHRWRSYKYSSTVLWLMASSLIKSTKRNVQATVEKNRVFLNCLYCKGQTFIVAKM